MCDGEDDCGDNTDERNCDPGWSRCSCWCFCFCLATSVQRNWSDWGEIDLSSYASVPSLTKNWGKEIPAHTRLQQDPLWLKSRIGNVGWRWHGPLQYKANFVKAVIRLASAGGGEWLLTLLWGLGLIPSSYWSLALTLRSHWSDCIGPYRDFYYEVMERTLEYVDKFLTYCNTWPWNFESGPAWEFGGHPLLNFCVRQNCSCWVVRQIDVCYVHLNLNFRRRQEFPLFVSSCIQTKLHFSYIFVFSWHIWLNNMI